MAYWQIAAGDKNRDYVHICLKWGVVLNGPGYAGPWPDCRNNLAADGTTPRKLTDIQRFCETVADQDIVVLRLGTDEIHGVGRIAGGYEWNEAFGDIDGWALEHVRRVDWLWRAPQGQPKRFPAYTLKLGDTTQQLTAQEVIRWALAQIKDAQPGKLVELPAPGKPLEVDDMATSLFDYGIGSGPIASVVNQIAELNRLASWYRKYAMPSERETISHLIVPLFHALGWTLQHMAVEWSYVDVALFKAVPRSDANLRVVVEAKKIDDSCLSAASQALEYAMNEGRDSCDRLVVTDGVRYGVYLRREDGTFSEGPDAYLNLASPRHAYPVLGCKGADTALLMMSKDWTASATLKPHASTQAPESV